MIRKIVEKLPIEPTEQSYKNKMTECQYLCSFKYILPYLEGKRVLDVGCATGQYLACMGEGSLGIELSDPNLEICKKKGLNVKKDNINKIPLGIDSGEFPVVFCSHVLEHVDSPLNLLKEFNRILSAHGTLVIGLPTEYTIVRYLKDRYFKSHSGHLYGFSLENIEQLFGKTGFSIENIVIDINWVRQLKLWWFLWLVQKLPKWMSIWFSNAYWVIARKVI